MIEHQPIVQEQPIPSTDLPGASQSVSRWREVAPAAAVIVAGLGARLAWLAATNYTFEDAFITFQFAKRLAAGQGFVYNTGEPIYGTTTPLLALLLAGWFEVFPDNVVAGARLLDLLASAGGLALTWAVLSEVGVAARGRVCALALLAVSDKLWLFDTGGMETPLLFCFMMAALYAHLRGWPVRAGFFSGLLLWTRVDLVAWPAALVLGCLWRRKPLPGRFLASTALTYLPWLVFATLRFGSATPHTITAKWVHYQMGIASSLTRSARDLFAWISPFGAYEIAPVWQIGLAGGTLLLAAWGALETSARPGLEVFWIFVLLEAALIVLTGATFEERYFVPMLSTTLVLAGFGLAAMVSRLSGDLRSRAVRTAAAAAGCAGAVFFAAHSAPHYRDVQAYRHERSLMAIGKWLNAHTPRAASVLLEPLGYAGYLADRRMIDEVGLVSPQVVQLGRQKFSGDSVEFSRVLLSKLQPDYFVTHCDDALRVFSRSPSEHDIQPHYSRQAVFNPMNFDPGESPARDIARRSCYEIWGGNRPE
jgi:hypothetical protein